MQGNQSLQIALMVFMLVVNAALLLMVPESRVAQGFVMLGTGLVVSVRGMFFISSYAASTKGHFAAKVLDGLRKPDGKGARVMFKDGNALLVFALLVWVFMGPLVGAEFIGHGGAASAHFWVWHLGFFMVVCLHFMGAYSIAQRAVRLRYYGGLLVGLFALGTGLAARFVDWGWSVSGFELSVHQAGAVIIGASLAVRMAYGVIKNSGAFWLYGCVLGASMCFAVFSLFNAPPAALLALLLLYVCMLGLLGGYLYRPKRKEYRIF